MGEVIHCFLYFLAVTIWVVLVSFPDSELSSIVFSFLSECTVWSGSSGYLQTTYSLRQPDTHTKLLRNGSAICAVRRWNQRNITFAIVVFCETRGYITDIIGQGSQWNTESRNAWDMILREVVGRHQSRQLLPDIECTSPPLGNLSILDRSMLEAFWWDKSQFTWAHYITYLGSGKIYILLKSQEHGMPMCISFGKYLRDNQTNLHIKHHA